MAITPDQIQRNTGFASNPSTGQMQQVYAKFGPGSTGDSDNINSWDYSDYSFDPTGRQSLAGWAPGYYTDNSGTFDNFMERAILGGLGAIAGAGAAGVGAGAGSAAAGGSAAAEGGLGAAAAGGGQAALGSGLSASAGTADVMGTGGALSGGVYSSAGGSGLLGGAAGGGGLSITPAMSEAAGFGGATGVLTGGGAATTSGMGSIVNALGGMGNIIGTGASLYGLNQLSNSYRNLADQAKNYSSLDQPQRAPYQQNLSQLVNNPSQYLNTDPYATSLASLYKNQIIPRNIAQSGNPASVLDTQGSQFVNQLSQNYNTQMGNLSGIAGFGFPQSSYAGYMGGQLGAGSALANAGGLATLGNMLGQNIGRMQGQSGSTGAFGSLWS